VCVILIFFPANREWVIWRQTAAVGLSDQMNTYIRKQGWRCASAWRTWRSRSVWAVALAAGPLLAQGVSEADYFADVPEVLTVTRLSQPLSDTPGAVTVIDRDTIRRMGARDLVDVLRLVPGYLVSGYNGANLGVAYHAPIDEFGIRNLVQIDGRSVYSAYLLGDTHRGLQTVPLEDIERIEVLRGANSAAYGANALFGVINVITRHAADSLGARLAVVSGSDQVSDGYASLGWGDAGAAFRLSVSQLSDDGFLDAVDDRRVRQWHLRADGRPDAAQEWTLKLGSSLIEGVEGSRPRRTEWREHYLQARWQLALSTTEQLVWLADVTQEDIFDTIYTGTGRRFNTELQHHLAHGPDWRAVWGVGFKQESAQSPGLYQQRAGDVSMRESRLFGHLEWRPSTRWTANAGLYLSDHSQVGSYMAPRLMLNHHLAPGHTLRVGAGSSFRTPGIFELAGNSPSLFYKASGQVRPEQLLSQEVSYLGQLAAWRLTVDARAYRERLSDWITLSRTLPLDVENQKGFEVRGLEYQLRWAPSARTQLTWQQNFSQLDWENLGRVGSSQPPDRSSALTWFQRLPGALDLSVMWFEQAEMTWRGASSRLPSSRRLDLRLAHRFRVGAYQAELGWTVQSLNGQQVVGLPDNRLGRRNLLSLRLEP